MSDTVKHVDTGEKFVLVPEIKWEAREELIRELVAALERAVESLDVDNLTTQSVDRKCRKALANAKKVMG